MTPWFGTALGTLLGVMGAGLTLVSVLAARFALSPPAGPAPNPAGFGCLMMVILALVSGPGAFLFSLPLTCLLQRKLRAGARTAERFGIAVGAGLLLGLLNLAGTTLVLDGPRLASSARSYDLDLVLAALGGGLGLGLGCFLGHREPGGGADAE